MRISLGSVVFNARKDRKQNPETQGRTRSAIEKTWNVKPSAQADPAWPAALAEKVNPVWFENIQIARC